MIRYATISWINSCRSIYINTARNNTINYNPHMNKTMCSFLLLTRSESSGICSDTSVYASRIPGQGTQADPSILNALESSSTGVGLVTETTLSSGAAVSSSTEKLVDPAAAAAAVEHTLNEQIQFIPDALAISIQETEKCLTSLAAIGEAALHNLNIYVRKSTASKSTQVDPSVLNETNSSSSITGVEDVTESVLSPETVSTAEAHFDSEVVHTLSEQQQFIPDIFAIVGQGIETLVSVLEKPTLLRSFGLLSKLDQQTFEILHCDVGQPLCGTIITSTVLLRLIFIPYVVESLQQDAKIYNNVPRIKSLQGKIIKDDMNVFMKIDMSPWCQSHVIPVGYLMAYVVMMVNLPVESMKTGGTLWFTDLTLADPYYILPLVAYATIIITSEIAAKGFRLPNSIEDRLKESIERAFLPTVILTVAMNMPAALQCCLATYSAICLVEIVLLCIPEVRYKLNIEKRV